MIRYERDSVITVADRDRRRDRDGQACRDHGPPGGDEPPRQEVHGHGRQGEAQRVRELEPVVRRVDAPRQANDRREHSREERAEAEVLTAEREAVARGQRGRAHRVELFVRVDARPVDTRRQQRVEEERADDDHAEHDHRPRLSAGASRASGSARAVSKDDAVSSSVDHARAMVDGGSAIGPARTVSENAPDHAGRAPSPNRTRRLIDSSHARRWTPSRPGAAILATRVDERRGTRAAPRCAGRHGRSGGRRSD